MRAQLEARLREAVRDGNALAREVGELKAALKRAAHPGLPAGRHALPNGRAAASDKVRCSKSHMASRSVTSDPELLCAREGCENEAMVFCSRQKL